MLATSINITRVVTLALSLQVSLFIVLNALSGAELISAGVGASLRSSLHFFPTTVILAIAAFSGVKSFSLQQDGWLVKLLVGFLAFSLSLVSAILNQINSEEVLKIIVFFVHFANVFLVIPFLLSIVDYKEFLKRFSSFYCFAVFSVSVVSFYLYFSGYSPYSRLGYPFIPGVYSYMSVLAFILSAIVLRNLWLVLFFGLSIFLAGSRVGMVLAGVVIAIVFMSSFDFRKMIVACLFVLLGVFSWGWIGAYSKPYTVDRIDITSGRSEIWRSAYDMLEESPVFGYAKEITFGENEYGESLVAHNSFIDLSLTYGLFFSLLAYIFWVMLFLSAWNKRIYLYDRALIFLLFFVVLSKSLISNVFWTNMGDGVTYASLILLCAAVYSKRNENAFATG
ncbi:O-antigen ligase family protein [Marinobacter mobilis]|uniref:O-antigen ligase family protein n=1 Tax=Marinobacter mobilis TaxID=488533 RepID=UPI0035C6933B